MFSCDKTPISQNGRECRPPPVYRTNPKDYDLFPRAFCFWAEKRLGNKSGWVCHASEEECERGRAWWQGEPVRSTVGKCLDKAADDPLLRKDAEDRYEEDKAWVQGLERAEKLRKERGL